AVDQPQLDILAETALRDVRSAERLAPLDPELPMQRARLAQLGRDFDGAAAALRRALELYPENATLTHQLALSLAAINATDPRVDALLQEAIALDPHGEGAARRLRDQARVRAVRRDAAGTADALVAAVLLDPTVVADLATQDEGDDLGLLPG